MAFGHEKHDFLGRLVKKPVLRRNDQGQTYCYFELAVNAPQKADAERKRDGKYFKLLAQKWCANVIAAAEVGDWVSVTNAYSRQTVNTVEKDGHTTVYHDVLYVCDRLEVIQPNRGAAKEVKKEHMNADSNVGPGGDEQQRSIGEDDDFVLTPEEEKVTMELPF